MATIGFLGLGNMGGPMAANLVKAGYRVRGFDLVTSAVDEAKRAGVEAVTGVAEVAEGADVIVTMLPSGKHVLDVYQNALLSIAPGGALFIDCSTIDVKSARLAHAIITDKGMEAVDSPVSGGVAGATSGTLTFMVGGTDDGVKRATPILLAMGKKVVHCGPTGTGQAAKICNNLILGSSMIAVSEAFLLGESLGLSAQSLFDVTSASSGQCWSITSYCPVAGPVPGSPANHSYSPGFSAKLMLKDLNLAREAAFATGTNLPLSRHALDLYAEYDQAGNGGKDFSGIINHIRMEAK